MEIIQKIVMIFLGFIAMIAIMLSAIGMYVFIIMTLGEIIFNEIRRQVHSERDEL